MVSSRVYPGLERKPGGPDNWVEAARGLPSYIERIAKHLHYERGFSISHAIATAVNTVKRWARGGKVTKYGTTKNVSPKTIAQAAAAVASWEAKKRAGALALSDDLLAVIDLTDVGEDFAFDLLDLVEGQKCATCGATATKKVIWADGRAYQPSCDAHVKDVQDMLTRKNGDMTELAGVQDLSDGTGAGPSGHAILSAMNIKDLAERANRVEDPARRAVARQRVLELAGVDPEALLLDLASTIPPRNARGRASDGRKSFRGQGKWKHGFVPVNRAAKEAKAKGSPIAIKRLNRIFGKDRAPDDARQSTREVTTRRPNGGDRKQAATGRAGGRSAGGRKANVSSVKVDEKSHPGSEGAKDVAFLRRTPVADPENKNVAGGGGKGAALPKQQKEASKSSRIPERARQNWDEIPEALKTVRGGKKYVLAEFGGKQYVTEWVGGVNPTESTALSKRKVMRSLSSVDAANMAPEDLRALLSNPQVPMSVKTVARRALRGRSKEKAGA